MVMPSGYVKHKEKWKREIFPQPCLSPRGDTSNQDMQQASKQHTHKVACDVLSITQDMDQHLITSSLYKHTSAGVHLAIICTNKSHQNIKKNINESYYHQLHDLLARTHPYL
jgi:hypothetical protein